MKRIMKNDIGQVKVVKEGFSWTTLLFGIFVPLFRGDIKWALVMGGAGFVTFGLSWFAFPFFYNKVYIDNLLKQGYRFQ